MPPAGDSIDDIVCTESIANCLLKITRSVGACDTISLVSNYNETCIEDLVASKRCSCSKAFIVFLMRPTQIRNLIVLAALAGLSLWAITIASNFIIDYSWWKEVGQVAHLGQYAVVQHCANRYGRCSRLHCALDRSRKGTGFRRHSPTGISAILPADSSGTGDSSRTHRLGLD